MKIAFYDDELVHRQILQDYLLAYSFQMNRDIDIVSLKHANEILDLSSDCAILLLDIKLEDDLNGIDLARKLRLKGYQGLIILITSMDEFVFKGYEIEAFRYIMKPINQSDLFNILDAAIQKITISPQVFSVSFNSETTLVPMNDIFYIDSQIRNRSIHTLNEIFKTNESISALLERLPQNQFVQSHRSVIINLKQVKTLSANQVTLINGDVLPLSRGNQEIFKRKLHQFIQSRGI